MIPKLSEHASFFSPIQSQYFAFIERLKADGFTGDTNPDYANRVVLSTDNSIYQVLPQGVIFPKSADDIQLLVRLAHLEEFQSIVLSPRGGGTGTNGQSLTDGLIVDLSKHMNKVLEINAQEGWARVQTGVVKDQLNAAVKEQGLFFAPELSTSNRATVGGMINTDASGQGSVMYGKTRDHVLSLDTILLDGTLIQSGPISDEQLTKEKQRDDYAGHIHRVVDDAFNHNKEKIKDIFPELNRCLTGYDLAHIRTDNNEFNLNSVLCGSEGTLGFIVEAKVNLLKIPTFATLVNIRYTSFEGSLRHAKTLLNAAPTSIETVDSRVLGLAKDDIIWHSVAEFFPEKAGEDIQGVNLVEYTGNYQSDVENRIKVLTNLLDTALAEPNSKVLGYTLAQGHGNVKKIWAMRKKSVGLLGNAKGEGRPIPFVEDTAVPPENLADFIMEFRAVLDAHGLSYGMFGHVDAGVLHVRPAIDMKDEKNEALIRDITDKVVALTQKYDGLLWGEHGKGVRSEYATEFFGELYPVIQQVKGAFDPFNQLNPGKIATPFDLSKEKGVELGAELLKIDEVPMRGQFDRQIPLVNRDQFQAGMYCNGNGACYNFDPNDAMCPSYKGTRDRIHSPKGRASLMREWLRGMSEQGVDTQAVSDKIKTTSYIKGFFPRLNNTLKKRRGEYDFSNEVHESMMGCLACKSCVGQCPIKVDVPEFRAKFLEIYYSRYLRPVKDYVVGSMEYIMPTLARFPQPYNWMMEQAWINRMSANYLGITDSPSLSKLNIKREMKKRGIQFATPKTLSAISPKEKHKAVIIVQDAFTSYFETQLVLDTMELLTRLGFQAFLAPYKPNGKPLHVHGFFKAFEKAANKNLDMLDELATYDIPFVGVDPSMTLSFRSEYPKVIGDKRDVPTVNLLQEWLAGQTDQLSAFMLDKPFSEADETYHLLAHCTEKTNAPAAIQDWVQVFSLLGLSLNVENVGCCGMAGTYGHETANLQTSKDIYELSWKEKFNDETLKGRILATGYSCRSQVKRFDQEQILHPLQALLKHLN